MTWDQDGGNPGLHVAGLQALWDSPSGVEHGVGVGEKEAGVEKAGEKWPNLFLRLEQGLKASVQRGLASDRGVRRARASQPLSSTS